MQASTGIAGLTEAEAAERLRSVGPNRLPEQPPPGLLVIFFRQFLNPFIYILLVAALAALLVDQRPSAIFIGAVLVLNAAIGTVQEYSAQRAASALKRLVRGAARVVRDGRERRIDAEEVVPGDLVLLASGDRVPADMRLVDARALSIDESMLTGESLAVDKVAMAGDEEQEADAHGLGERPGRVFAGSSVVRGRGRGVVTATGAATAIGEIAEAVGGERASEPPLAIRIRRFTYTVAAAILLAIAALAALMVLRGGYAVDEIALVAIGLAVSAIPEGLPAALTVALAIGMRRMAKAKVVIRRLIAVESLGSCTFICSDKTGTLTVNELTVRRIVLPDGTSYTTTGEGVAPGTVEGPDPARLRPLCEAGLLANEASLDYAGGAWRHDGDIVDVAFLVLAKKLGLSLAGIAAERQRLDLVPYESERAFSASLNAAGEAAELNVKGAPERVIAFCDRMEVADGIVPVDHERILAQATELAREGHRVLALARAQVHAVAEAADAHLGGLVFLGLAGMIDPVRPEAAEAVRRCRSGGIEVAMVTGDHPETARAIALELGLGDARGPVLTGSDLRALEDDPAALDAAIGKARVFARIEPAQKTRIVQSLMAAGHFVAVTGDGVNDAPAMRAANVAVAMGGRGTDVAKEAADLIITDDNFASLAAGVDEGRIVYGNIRKVIALLVATGFSALLLFFVAVAAGLPMPLVATQLLWLNLVANGLQDVALAFERREGDEMDRPPRRPEEPVFDRHLVEHVLVIGGAMGLLAFAAFSWMIAAGYPPAEARTLTLMLMVLFGNVHALSARSERRSVFRTPLGNNIFLVLAVPLAQLVHIGAAYVPGLSDVLAIRPIALVEWMALLAFALLLLVVEEAHKATIRWRVPRRDRAI